MYSVEVMNAISQKQVGNRLAKLRKRAGLTQDQAAEKAGISQVTLSRLERGIQWTDFEVLLKLSRLYQVEWSDLLAVFPTGRDSGKRERIQDIVDILSKRELPDVELAVDILKALFRLNRNTRC